MSLAVGVCNQSCNTENRLSEVLLVSGACAENGALLAGWAFTYDGDGRRVKQVYTDGISSLTTYYFGGGAYEVQDDGTNTITRVYYAFAGTTIAMNDGSGLVYFLTDHLGSVVAVTDDTGALLSEQRYLPFGQVRTDVDGITQTDFGYTGQRDLDAQENAHSLGLMDYKARFYSPLLGRFVQPDSIIPNPMNPQAFNRYSYVINNPIRFTDPTGRTPCEGDNWDDGPQCLKNPNSYLSKMVANTRYQRDCAAGTNVACPGGTRGLLAFGVEAIFTAGLLEYGLLGGGVVDAITEGVRIIKAVTKGILACAANHKCEQVAIQEAQNISDDAFVRIDPVKSDTSINENGLLIRFSETGKTWLTKYKYISGVTNSTDLETILYNQNLWASKVGTFADGATLRLVNIESATPAGVTNMINGVPQWFVTNNIPPNVLQIIRVLSGD